MSQSSLCADALHTKLVNAGCIPAHKQLEALRVLQDVLRENVAFSLSSWSLQEAMLQQSKRLEPRDAISALSAVVIAKKQELQAVLKTAVVMAQDEATVLSQKEWLWIAQKYCTEQGIPWDDIKGEIRSYIGYESPFDTCRLLGRVAWLKRAEAHCQAYYAVDFKSIKLKVAEHVLLMSPEDAVAQEATPKGGKKKQKVLQLPPPGTSFDSFAKAWEEDDEF